jgi:hypothetical protein
MYCGNTIANGFGGMLAAGILSGLDGASGLAGWRYVAYTLFSGLVYFAHSLTMTLFTDGSL